MAAVGVAGKSQSAVGIRAAGIQSQTYHQSLRRWVVAAVEGGENHEVVVGDGGVAAVAVAATSAQGHPRPFYGGISRCPRWGAGAGGRAGGEAGKGTSCQTGAASRAAGRTTEASPACK